MLTSFTQASQKNVLIEKDVNAFPVKKREIKYVNTPGDEQEKRVEKKHVVKKSKHDVSNENLAQNFQNELKSQYNEIKKTIPQNSQEYVKNILNSKLSNNIKVARDYTETSLEKIAICLAFCTKSGVESFTEEDFKNSRNFSTEEFDLRILRINLYKAQIKYSEDFYMLEEKAPEVINACILGNLEWAYLQGKQNQEPFVKKARDFYLHNLTENSFYLQREKAYSQIGLNALIDTSFYESAFMMVELHKKFKSVFPDVQIDIQRVESFIQEYNKIQQELPKNFSPLYRYPLKILEKYKERHRLLREQENKKQEEKNYQTEEN